MARQADLGVAPNTPGPLGRLLDRVRGRPVEYDLGPYHRELGRIEQIGTELQRDSDARLRERVVSVRAEAARDRAFDDLVPEWFALVREAAGRVLGMRPFDVQMVGAMALYRGRLVEMQTGEGKTLVAVLPASLEALARRGVHILTFNDYLARRDAVWMGPVYQFLGLTVGCVQDGMGHEERREAYHADVTYLTAKQAGFDYLRDGLRYEPEARVHRPLNVAIVDEADSILVDEARIPLVIAGRARGRQAEASTMAGIARALEAGVDFETDDSDRNVYLTDTGIARVEERLGGVELHAAKNAALLTGINVALHAEILLRRDVDYIVRNDRVELVDEYTGRVVQDRHWPDGLQAAVEAKEGLRLEYAGTILGSITLQHFLALYPKRSGMTATARPEDQEFFERYGLRVVPIPPNCPCARRDLPDRVFTHREAKHRGLVDEIQRVHATGRPLLVGTASVRESEDLAERLRAAGITCEVLNAKTDELEATIIAEAGAVGAVTISTNMAGRGTDIRLGGANERERERVVALGGLYVIGTNRHESTRIDMQLRGRAGRQGDPGESRFFVSLEDDLMVRYGIDKVLAQRHCERREEPLDDPIVNRRIAWAQRVVEGQNADIRRTLWEYSTLVERQRLAVRRRREEALGGATFCADRTPESYRALGKRVGRQVSAIERRIALSRIDERWAEHLAEIADTREGIHMMRLAGLSPLTEFSRTINRAFRDMVPQLDEQIVETFEAVATAEGDVDLAKHGVSAPSATWTYLVNDNPFEKSLSLLTGHDLGLSIGAVLLGPIFMLTALYARYFKGRRRRPG